MQFQPKVVAKAKIIIKTTIKYHLEKNYLTSVRSNSFLDTVSSNKTEYAA